MEGLGIDIGGSGIKGAPVNLETGELTAERYRLPTPDPAEPQPVAETLAMIVQHFAWTGPVGCGFPSVIQHGISRTAANISPNWIGQDAARLFSEAAGCRVCVINDADAAGLAEMKFGAGRGRKGVVLLVTVGTGLGTAVFTNGQLLPNTELGHIEINGQDAELTTSDAARKREDLSWEKWAVRFDRYLNRLEALLWPDLIILGGGASKKAGRFIHRLTVKAEVVPALLLNQAGITGAALACQE